MGFGNTGEGRKAGEGGRVVGWGREGGRWREEKLGGEGRMREGGETEI